MKSGVWRRASQSVVLPAPDGAETTNRIPVRLNCLLKVEDLLADFFQLRFAGNHMLGDAGVVRFGAKGIQLTKNFLGNELEGAADRLVLTQVMSELGEVALEPGQDRKSTRL